VREKERERERERENVVSSQGDIRTHTREGSVTHHNNWVVGSNRGTNVHIAAMSASAWITGDGGVSNRKKAR